MQDKNCNILLQSQRKTIKYLHSQPYYTDNRFMNLKVHNQLLERYKVYLQFHA